MPDPADSSGLVLDTSVWINLLATDAMEAILAALATPCHAPEQVVAELKRHPTSGVVFPFDDHPLRRLSPMASIRSLDATELDLFLGLVGAPAGDALGDGESAAIAIAVNRGLGLVVDDGKARRILRERFDQVLTYWTVDLLRAPSVIGGLGRSRAEDCFDKARRFGRMRIPRS